MRLSTVQQHRQSITALLGQQAQLTRTQTQLAANRKLLSAADDPAASAQVLQAEAWGARQDSWRQNAITAQNRLALEEAALANAGGNLNRVRELALQANSGSQSVESRKIIAQEMQQQLDDLLAQANSGDGEDGYLFGGTQRAASPFALAAGGVSYSGDDGQRLLSLGEHRQLADGDSGPAVFMNLASGNGRFAVQAASTNTGSAAITASALVDATVWDGGSYSLSFSAGSYSVQDGSGNTVASGSYQSGAAIRFRGAELRLGGAVADGDRFAISPSQPRDIFSVVRNLVTWAQAPADSAASRAQRQTELFNHLGEIDTGLDRLNSVRASVGNRLNAASDAQSQIEAGQLQTEQTLAGLRDLDYAEASTRLNLQMTALQAAQQSYMRVQGLSLFDYLR